MWNLLAAIRVASLILASSPVLALAQSSMPKAHMFYKHELIVDAKREAIRTVFSSTSDEEQASAKLLLARIAADEDRFHHAVELWKDILQNHSTTKPAHQAKLLLEQSVSLVDKSAKHIIDNAVALTYFSAAEFWLGDIDPVFRIDTSWLHSEAAAIHWLDRIIVEFPGTKSAEVAHQYRVRAYLGASGSGRYGLGGSGAWGAASRKRAGAEDASGDFSTFAEKAEQAIRQLEKDFPDSTFLPRLRFKMAHTYWLVDERDKAEPWLSALVENTGAKEESFWSHLARLRMANWRD